MMNHKNLSPTTADKLNVILSHCLLSAAELAELLSVHKSTVQRWKNGMEPKENFRKLFDEIWLDIKAGVDITDKQYEYDELVPE